MSPIIVHIQRDGIRYQVVRVEGADGRVWFLDLAPARSQRKPGRRLVETPVICNGVSLGSLWAIRGAGARDWAVDAQGQRGPAELPWLVAQALAQGRLA
ncbi:MAG: hypothetical protein WC789_05850 [Lentisphaeria bacterium]|jgi:hypothetical protein